MNRPEQGSGPCSCVADMFCRVCVIAAGAQQSADKHSKLERASHTQEDELGNVLRLPLKCPFIPEIVVSL